MTRLPSFWGVFFVVSIKCVGLFKSHAVFDFGFFLLGFLPLDILFLLFNFFVSYTKVKVMTLLQ